MAAVTALCPTQPFCLRWAWSSQRLKDLMKASWMDKVVSCYKAKNTPRPHSSPCAYTGSGWRGRRLCAFYFPFPVSNTDHSTWGVAPLARYGSKYFAALHHPALSVPRMEKAKTGRVSKCQFKCQGQSTNCRLKQSWETTQSNSYKHFPFLNARILFLHNYVLSEQDSTALRNSP